MEGAGWPDLADNITGGGFCGEHGGGLEVTGFCEEHGGGCQILWGIGCVWPTFVGKERGEAGDGRGWPDLVGKG